MHARPPRKRKRKKRGRDRGYGKNGIHCAARPSRGLAGGRDPRLFGSVTATGRRGRERPRGRIPRSFHGSVNGDDIRPASVRVLARCDRRARILAVYYWTRSARVSVPGVYACVWRARTRVAAPIVTAIAPTSRSIRYSRLVAGRSRVAIPRAVSSSFENNR